MNSADKRLIEVLREGLPISTDPYAELASRLRLSRDEVLHRLNRLREAGVIRRFGVKLNFQRLGITSLFVAFEVPPNLVEAFCHSAAKRRYVSHCYERKTPEGWRYNVFCVVHGRTRDECEKYARALGLLGANSYIVIPAICEFRN